MESELKQDELEIVLFGASTLGKYAGSVLRTSSTKVLAFVDNDPAKWGLDFEELPVMSPDYLKTLPNSVEIVICSSSSDQIAEQLKSMGIQTFRVFEAPYSLRSGSSKKNPTTSESSFNFIENLNQIRTDFGQVLELISDQGLVGPQSFIVPFLKHNS